MNKQEMAKQVHEVSRLITRLSEDMERQLGRYPLPAVDIIRRLAAYRLALHVIGETLYPGSDDLLA